MEKLLAIFVFIFSTTAFSVEIKTQEILKTQDVIWGFDFLPEGKIIFSERGGRLKIYSPAYNKISEIKQELKIYSEGQGGLLDVRVSPEFKTNGHIFVTYSKTVDDNYTTALARLELKNEKVVQWKDIFVSKAQSKNSIHFGSRIEFGPSGTLFVSVGDRNERDRAQNLTSHNGKILRMDLDGNPVNGNPFKESDPYIWSLGHRNPQGLVLDKKNKILFETEFGPRGGDELNIIQAGKNYGWPLITYEREYWGPKIGEGTEKKGLEQPMLYWVPSISPSAVTIYTGNKISDWADNLFIACLSGTQLRRIVISNGKVVLQEELLKNKNLRMRNVRTGSDGWLYVSTDQGQILKIFK